MEKIQDTIKKTSIAVLGKIRNTKSWFNEKQKSIPQIIKNIIKVEIKQTDFLSTKKSLY